MATIKVLKVGTRGVPTEQATTDDALFESYQVNDPTTKGLKPTGSMIAFDNVVAKERDNVFTTAGALLFPAIADSAGEVDAFRLPQRAGIPTATPTASGEGFVVWDSTNNMMYVWNGSAWTNSFASASSANNIDTTFNADTGGLTARQAVYITDTDEVGPASNASLAASEVIGFNTSGSVSAGNPAVIRSRGTLGGFSSLTPGALQYLGTAGGITETKPSGPGESIVKVGYAKSATELFIDIQQYTVLQ